MSETQRKSYTGRRKHVEIDSNQDPVYGIVDDTFTQDYADRVTGN